MADISTIIPDDRTIEIKHPQTGANIGLRVTLVSIEDEALASTKRRIQDQRLKLEAKGRNFTAEDVEDNRLTILFKATKGWEWHTDEDGEPGSFDGQQPEFNRTNFMTIMKAVYWIADQINAAVGDEKAFFKRSKTI